MPGAKIGQTDLTSLDLHSPGCEMGYKSSHTACRDDSLDSAQEVLSKAPTTNCH